MIFEPISFCINTAVNELDNLKLLFKSLKDNLRYNKHEIIVFIDSDNEGTYEWLLTQKSEFYDLKILKNPLPICYGYARNINEMFNNKVPEYFSLQIIPDTNHDLKMVDMCASQEESDAAVYSPYFQAVFKNWILKNI